MFVDKISFPMKRLNIFQIRLVGSVDHILTMSENTAIQYTSQFIEAFDDVQKLYQKWQRQRQETMLKIRSISHDIQNLETMHRKGHLAYSSVGIVGGVMTIAGIVGAPFTFGRPQTLSRFSLVYLLE